MALAYNVIGEEKLHKMIDIFYQYVKNDDRINHLFPEDFSETVYKQKLFQTQFLGGPNVYNEKYGHPMLKARHFPFVVTPLASAAWLENMNQAIIDVELDDELREYLMARYTLTAQHMVNSDD